MGSEPHIDIGLAVRDIDACLQFYRDALEVTEGSVVEFLETSPS